MAQRVNHLCRIRRVSLLFDCIFMAALGQERDDPGSAGAGRGAAHVGSTDNRMLGPAGHPMAGADAVSGFGTVFLT